MKEVILKHSAWFGDKNLTISFPNNWIIDIFSPQKINRLPYEKISSKINEFIENLNIDRHKKDSKIAIIIDDISRPTPVSQLIILLVNKLIANGINSEQIVIVVAGGTHDQMRENEIQKKLGDEIVSNYKIIIHNMNKDLKHLGKTSHGTPIFINSIVAKCDLIIGIGGIYPHSPTGFGGGAKLSLGICGFKTIAHLHYHFNNGSEIGGDLDNLFRKELEEISRQIGLNLFINVVINDKREILELFSGDIINSHKKAVEFIKPLYNVPPPNDADIVIANTYPFDTTLLFSKKGWWPTSLSKMNSINIIIGAFPLGIGNHGIHPIIENKFQYAYRKFFLSSKLPPQKVLTLFLSKLLSKNKTHYEKSEKKTIYFTPEGYSFSNKKLSFKFFTSWKDITTFLDAHCENINPKVKIYACAPLQFPIPYLFQERETLYEYVKSN